MIRCVRMWTGEDGDSLFEEGWIDLSGGVRNDPWRRAIDISRALQVNTEFDISRQLWSHLVTTGAIPDPRAFIESCPPLGVEGRYVPDCDAYPRRAGRPGE